MRIKTLLPFLAASVLALLSGCAVGNKYDYRLSQLPLPVKGTSSVGVSVTDSRPYILDGDKAPNFVGLQRGGFGNPFNVTTASGNAMVDDMETSIANGLTARGFSVSRLDVVDGDADAISIVAQRDGLFRVIVLNVLEWKSDAMMKLTIHCNLQLKVYDAHGALVAESSSEKVEAVGGAKLESGNSRTVAQEFERAVGRLFSDPAIIQALGGAS